MADSENTRPASQDQDASELNTPSAPGEQENPVVPDNQLDSTVDIPSASPRTSKPGSLENADHDELTVNKLQESNNGPLDHIQEEQNEVRAPTKSPKVSTTEEIRRSPIVESPKQSRAEYSQDNHDDLNSSTISIGPKRKSDLKKSMSTDTVTEPPDKKLSLEDKRFQNFKEKKINQLFDSKGSLIENESFVKAKIDEFKSRRLNLSNCLEKIQHKVNAYKKKPNLTTDEISDLKKYTNSFLEKMNEYEELTRDIEKLMGMTDVPTSQLDMKMAKPPLKKYKPTDKHPRRPSQIDSLPDNELPKMIVCAPGVGDSVPRIVVCEPLKNADLEPFYKSRSTGAEEEIIGKLNDYCESQQKLAAENAQMAQMRLQLQQELFDKQELLFSMQQSMKSLEMENIRIATENNELQKQLLVTSQNNVSSPKCKRELFTTLQQHPSELASNEFEDLPNLEQGNISPEYGNIYCQLEASNRQAGSLSPGFPMLPNHPICKLMLPQKSTQTDEDKEKNIIFESEKDPKYKELKEQYQRLHLDFKNKVAEVATLRVDLDKTRNELEDITVLHYELESKYQREMEQNTLLNSEKQQFQSYKEKLMSLEQEAKQAKNFLKASQEEIEDMRLVVEEQSTQLDDYRGKYMKTLQLSEQLKKENDFKEKECAKQIAVEVQRMKLEMQEHLAELMPIKDLLKTTQHQLRETEQMHAIALETIDKMAQQLENVRAEADALRIKVEGDDADGNLKENLIYSLEEAEKKMKQLETENDNLKDKLRRMEEAQGVKMKLLEERGHEVLQLSSQLDTLREESARLVARVKERAEIQRRSLHSEVSEMERELAQCRADTVLAVSERDEIRNKLQMEICLLSDNFRESQNRIIQLQHHVDYLRASHPAALIDIAP